MYGGRGLTTGSSGAHKKGVRGGTKFLTTVSDGIRGDGVGFGTAWSTTASTGPVTKLGAGLWHLPVYEL